MRSKAVLCNTCRVLLCVREQPRVYNLSAWHLRYEAQLRAIGPIGLRPAPSITPVLIKYFNYGSKQQLVYCLTDFVCLYTYEFWLSLWKIVRSSVILLLPLYIEDSDRRNKLKLGRWDKHQPNYIRKITEMTKHNLCKYNSVNGEPDPDLTLDHI